MSILIVITNGTTFGVSAYNARLFSNFNALGILRVHSRRVSLCENVREDENNDEIYTLIKNNF